MNHHSVTNPQTLENTQNRTLLIIDDDKKLCTLIHDYLTPLGWHVEMKHTGPQGLAQALSTPYHAIIIDIMMPGMDGFDVLRELRKTSNTPVLMLTAMGDEADRIVGLELGADDYLPKTFSSRELLARLRAVTRRSSPQNSTTHIKEAPTKITSGPLTICPASHTALLNNQPLELTTLEFAILLSLIKSKGRVKSREDLLEDVSERRFDIFDRSIDVHISQLRKKLNDNPKKPTFITTIRGIGYRFEEGGQP